MAHADRHEDVFQAIASPTRRALIDALGHGERIVSDLVASLDITQSAVSQQLSILKSAGLVSERAEGRFRYYRLRAAPLNEVEGFLNRYRAHVERQLDTIGRLLDDLPDPPTSPPPPLQLRRRKKAR